MANELAQAAGLSELLHHAPPGCVLYWARGLVVDSEIGGKEEQSPFRRVEIANVDERLKHYDLCVEQPNADFAGGDVVSLFGHAVADSPVAAWPRVILNHNTAKWFPVYPLPDEGLWDMSYKQYGDWLAYTGKPDIFKGGVFRRGNPNKTGHQQVREGLPVDIFFQGVAVIAGGIAALVLSIVLLINAPGVFFVLLVAGVGFLIWRKSKAPPQVNLAPVYQEMVNRAQTFALNNPDPEHSWETRPRY